MKDPVACGAASMVRRWACNRTPWPQMQVMKTTFPNPSRADLTSTRVLAALLERLDRSACAVDAQQYRSVVHRLSDALDQMESGAALDALLAEFPDASQLYENRRYQHAGLCRSPLDPALAAEVLARQWIDRARARG